MIDNTAAHERTFKPALLCRRFDLLSSAGLWALYVAFVALRVFVITFSHKATLIERHGATAAAGLLLTWCFHLALRRLAARSLAAQIAAAALIAFIPASLLAIINYDVLFVFDPCELWSTHERQSVSLLVVATQTMIENYLMFVTWATLAIAVESATREQDARQRAAIRRRPHARLNCARYSISSALIFCSMHSIRSRPLCLKAIAIWPSASSRPCPVSFGRPSPWTRCTTLRLMTRSACSSSTSTSSRSALAHASSCGSACRIIFGR